MQASKHKHTCVQCSHASVGLAQARPKYLCLDQEDKHTLSLSYLAKRFCDSAHSDLQYSDLRALASTVICETEETKKGAVTGNQTQRPWFELSML